MSTAMRTQHSADQWEQRVGAGDWDAIIRVYRWPDRITDTPCRTGAGDHTRAELTFGLVFHDAA